MIKKIGVVLISTIVSLFFIFGVNIAPAFAICGDGVIEVDQGEMCDQGANNGDNRACSSSFVL